MWIFDSIGIQITAFLQKQHVLDRQCQDQNPTIAHCSSGLLKFSTVMTSPGPAFQECTGVLLENVPSLKARIEVVAILVHYQPSYNTLHT